MKKITIPILIGLAILVALETPRAQTTAKRRPNILFLFSDDQRADTIRALGNGRITTPNLDRLVNEGVTFNRAYCMGSQQGAVCVPSRAMLMSGRTLFRISEKLEGQTTWPQVFAQNGYVTFGVGKWHNQPPSFVNTFAEGKAVFFGGMSDPYAMPVQDLDPDRKLVNKRNSETHATQLFADSAIEFLQKQRGDKPFALYVAFTLPHDPRVAPPEYRAMYSPEKLPLPKNFLPEHPFDNGEMKVRDEKLAPWPRTPEIVREHLADYYACVTYLDAQIGRILDALRRTGQYDNTIIVFASDHGLAIGSHGLFGKQNLYEHSMNTPLIIAGPGVPKNRRSDAFAYLLDLFPTLCDLAGLKTPAEVEGLSLAPVIAGQQRSRRETIFTAYRDVQRAVRDDRWKLIVYPQINRRQLFDLKNDPAEMNDLSANPKFSKEVERMSALLKKAQAPFGDPINLIPDQKSAQDNSKRPRPNILFAIADDWSFGHAGAYGAKWVKTPAFDRVARDGALFTRAYTPNAKCAPSRAIILTGRNSWQLEEAANHIPFFPAKFKTWAETLGEKGYFTGLTAKGWGPGAAPG